MQKDIFNSEDYIDEMRVNITKHGDLEPNLKRAFEECSLNDPNVDYDIWVRVKVLHEDLWVEIEPIWHDRNTYRLISVTKGTSI